jgi:hypothetical protein
MKPMGLIFTPFISYYEIKVEETDLFEDAWGFNSEFCDVISFLGKIDTCPGNQLTERLIAMISKQN